MIYNFENCSLDIDRRELRRAAALVSIDPQVFDLLQYLIRNRERVVTRDDLISHVWNGRIVSDSTLTSRITSARQAIGDSGDQQRLIRTITRKGIRFVGEVRENHNAIGQSEHKSPASADGALANPIDGAEAQSRDKPSIAVLPFLNMSGDAEQEYFADGLGEDIITALARYRWFSVIARNSTFVYKGRPIDVKQVGRELGVRYVLEGSVRRSAQRARITAQLIETRTGSHIWAERYDRELAEVFAIQDEIAERVAGAIEPELLRRESVHIFDRSIGSTRASDLLRRGIWYFHQLSEPTHLRALELFREAAALDPQIAEAHVWTSRAAIGVAFYNWGDDTQALQKEAEAAARKAIQLDERNAYPHFNMAVAHTFAGSFDQAIRFADKAIELSPSFALGHLALGMALLYSGKAPEAIAPFERGLQLDPFDPQNSHWFRLLGLAFHFSGQSERALGAALKAADLRPAWPLTLQTLAICYAALDRLDDARDCVEQLRKLDPPKGDPISRLRLRNPDWNQNMLMLLRKAGAS